MRIVHHVLSARADDISVTTSSQSLRTSAHLYQLELTAFSSLSGHLYQLELTVSTPSQNLGTFDHIYQLDLTIFCRHTIPESWDLKLTVFLSLSLSARADSIYIVTSGHLHQLDHTIPESGHLYQLELTVLLSQHHPRILGRQADSISITTSTQNLGTPGHTCQLDLTVFLSPHRYHPRILGRPITSISYLYHNTIPESWDVWPHLSVRSDSISVATPSQNLGTSSPLSQQYFYPLELRVTVQPPLSARADSISITHHPRILGHPATIIS
jgi:hypothetical protein